MFKIDNCIIRTTPDRARHARRPALRLLKQGRVYNLDQDACAASGFDLLLGDGREELGLHHHWLRYQSLAADLEEAVLRHVDDGRLARGRDRALGQRAPEHLDVDHGAVVARLRPVELAHADLTEVTGVELVK